MSKNKYKSAVTNILQPTILSSGFSVVELSSCISYESLYRRGRQWFGTSFDYRDQYLEVKLGNLYWFKDVMPRVIIMGDFSEYCDINLNDILASEGLDSVVTHIKDLFYVALNEYEKIYPKVLEECLRPPQGKYRPEYVLMIGNEVNDKELEKFYS